MTHQLIVDLKEGVQVQQYFLWYDRWRKQLPKTAIRI